MIRLLRRLALAFLESSAADTYRPSIEPGQCRVPGCRIDTPTNRRRADFDDLHLLEHLYLRRDHPTTQTSG